MKPPFAVVRKCLITLMLGILFSWTMAGIASADTLALRNGDVLSGSVVEFSQGILVFQTSLTGKVLITAEEIRYLVASAPQQITFKDGSKRVVRLSEHDKMTWATPPNALSGQALDWAAVDTMHSEPASPKGNSPQVEEAGAAWGGAWETGVQTRFGSDDYTSLFGKLTLWRDSERYSFLTSLYTESAGQDEFPRVFRGVADWKASGSSSDVYPRFRWDVERDRSNALGLRSDLSANMERPLLDSADRSLDVSVGLNWTAEYNDLRLVPEEKLPARLQSRLLDRWSWSTGTASFQDEEQELALRIGLNHEGSLVGKTRLKGSLTVLPELTSRHDLRAQYESALLYPFTTGLKLRLNLRVDYDSAPAFSVLESWQGSVGAGMEWAF